MQATLITSEPLDLAALVRDLDITGIGVQDILSPCAERGSGGPQPAVLVRGTDGGQALAGLRRLLGHSLCVFSQICDGVFDD